jgi:hypothetical protein
MEVTSNPVWALAGGKRMIEGAPDALGNNPDACACVPFRLDQAAV